MSDQIQPWPVLRPGSRGHPVPALQYVLRDRGHAVTVDGTFGPGTEAAVGSRCFRMTDIFLWLPKRFLLVQFALTGKTAQGACCLRRRLTSEETLTGTRGRISQNGQICFRVAKLPASGILNVLSLHMCHTGPVR